MKPYLAHSLESRARAEDVERLATWLGVELWQDRPLPADRPGLVLGRTGPRLLLPGAPPLPWHPGLTPFRIRRLPADPLVCALELRPGDVVLDATLGLGHDAAVMRAAGATVVGVEKSPLLAWFTWEGHGHLAGPPLHLRLGDFREVLRALPDGSVDHVYFDPLFPADVAGTGPTWAPVRTLGTTGRLDAATLRDALRVARKRVALKLAPGEAPPVGAEQDGPHAQVVASKRCRLAVFQAGPARAG